MPVINSEKSSDNPSSLKSKLTPNEEIQPICWYKLLPELTSGICVKKNTNNKNGTIGNKMLHFVLSIFPKGTVRQEKNNPDNTVNSIYSFIMDMESHKNNKKVYSFCYKIGITVERKSRIDQKSYI